MENYVANLLTGKIGDKVLRNISFERKVAYEDIFSYQSKDVALNIRIPFCKSICAFCAFPGELYRDAFKDFFLKGLEKELELYSKMCDSYMGKTPIIRRVYFSGGTPSLLHRELKGILRSIEDILGFSGDVALESHPSDLNGDILDSLINSGVTQISIGVQSFSKETLLRIGRFQSPESVKETIRKVLNCGFDYVNIDLIFGLDDQPLEDLVEDLRVVVELGVDGISTYPLMVLPYSKTKASLRVVTENKLSSMYSLILDHMERESYKVRAIWSFSRDPEKYIGPYEYDNFFGLGPGAWGLFGRNFTLNTMFLEDYLAYLHEDTLPIHSIATLRDSPFLGLARMLYRTKVSMDYLDHLKGRYRNSYYAITLLLNLLKSFGLLSREGDFLKLTRKGLIHGNLVTKKIVEELLTKINEIWKNR